MGGGVEASAAFWSGKEAVESVDQFHPGTSQPLLLCTSYTYQVKPDIPSNRAQPHSPLSCITLIRLGP